MNGISSAGGGSPYGINSAFRSNNTTLAINTASDPIPDDEPEALVGAQPLSPQEKLEMFYTAEPNDIKKNISDKKSWYCGNYINILMRDHETENIAVFPSNTRLEIEEINQQKKRFIFIPLNVNYEGGVEQGNENHWVAIIVDKIHQKLFYLDPAAKTSSEDFLFDDIKKFVNEANKYEIIFNPINFQISENGDEYGLIHCGPYTVKIFEQFKKHVDDGKTITNEEAVNDEQKISITTVLFAVSPASGIGRTDAIYVDEIRETHKYEVSNLLNIRNNPDLTQLPPTKVSVLAKTEVGKLDCLSFMPKKELDPRRQQSSLYKKLEVAFKKARNRNLKARNGNKQAIKIRTTYDSDNEDLDAAQKIETFPRMAKAREAVSSADMTIAITYFGKEIRFKGNQLIIWTQKMMEKALPTPDREHKIAEACRTSKANVKKPEDWLSYEGMFESWGKMAAKKSDPFFGILNVFFNEDTCTEIKFQKKNNNPEALTYCYLCDTVAVNYIQTALKKETPNLGMSYPAIVKVIKYNILTCKVNDATIAKRQLEIFKGSVEGEITPFDRFLAFFNAVLFGSEASRNSTSFVTGIIILELISKEQLTYVEAFETEEDKRKFAAYPMASPNAGKGNTVGYKKLIELSNDEAKRRELSSLIGMQSSRKTPQWAQIQLKEAILLKYWSKKFGSEPVWLNASEDIRQNGHAIEFARRFNESIVTLLRSYFLPDQRKLYVYSKDELDHLFPGFSPSDPTNKWKHPEDQMSTETTFDALELEISAFQPLKLEKIRQDAYWNVVYDIYDELESLG